MTITSLAAPPLARLTGAAFLAGVLVALCAMPGAALAWQQRTAQAQQPNYQPNYNAYQAQQANQQAILQDKLRTSQVLEQQRQRNAAAIRQPLTNNPAATQSLDLSNQAQLDRFNARQRDAVDQYRAASSTAPVVLPQPVRPSAPKPPPQSSVLDQLKPAPSTQQAPAQNQPTRNQPQR